MKKLLIILLLHAAAFQTLFSQTLMNKDSLLKLLPQAKEDTNAVLLYINLGQQYESNEPAVAKAYYRKAGYLSRKLNYPKGVIKYINNYTFVLNQQGLYDSSVLLNLQAVALARETRDSANLFKTLFNTGTSYRVQGDYENAALYYEEGKAVNKAVNDEAGEALLEDILQVLYTDLHKYEKGIQAGTKSVALFRKLGYRPQLGAALTNLGINYFSANRIDEAEPFLKEALEIGKKINDKNLEMSSSLTLGSICMKRNDFDGMKLYMDKALVLSKGLESHEGELLARRGLSYCYQFWRKYEIAKKYADEALAISYQYNLRVQRQKMFSHLSNLAYSMQDMQAGEAYSVQSDLLGDSLLNETIEENTIELEKKYETEKKENRIQILEAQGRVQELSLQRRGIFNFVLIGGIVVLGVILLLSYRTYQQKQVLQLQRIRELEQEKHLASVEAVLRGEEKERSRLAKDLHDGLGGMLSGIKFSFKVMQENLVMTPENRQAFDRSMDMLDTSIVEMRRVAHNMMPESLVKFGLDTALKDFCSDINQSGALEINYQSIGLTDARLEQTTAITVYRIVQELINNTLKHAAAQTAIVQVAKTDDQLTVTVEDDGKGFDSAKIKNASGMGWSNIQHRVDFLKGRLDVDSKPGQGTSVQIEFSI